MKKILIAILAIVIATRSFGQSSDINVIPIPVSVQSAKGNFVLTKTSFIELKTNDTDAKRVAKSLSKKLSVPTGFAMLIKSSVQSNSNGKISISLINDASLGNEGYKLEVTQHKISLSANKPAGLFYGMQTLIQLLPKEIESKTAAKNITWVIPCASIK